MKSEIISRQVAAELVVVDPFDPTRTHGAADILGIVKSGRERVEFWRGKVAALGELGEQPVAVLKEMKKAVEADNKALTGYGTKYANGVVEFCGLTDNVRALDVQIKGTGRSVDPASIRGGLESIIADLDAAIKAQTPPEPVHTYIMQMEITDGDLKKVVAAVTKCEGARFRVAEATKDKDMKWAERFFAEMI